MVVDHSKGEVSKYVDGEYLCSEPVTDAEHLFYSSDDYIMLYFSNIGCCGSFYADNVFFQSIPSVPEPSTLFLLAMGLIGIVGIEKRRC